MRRLTTRTATAAAAAVPLVALTLCSPGLASAGAGPQRQATGSSSAATSGATSGATSPTELSTSDRLSDRREVTAGQRAYSIGFEDGRFYGNGWHITGEMGGVWTPPVKLLDGVWFGLDGHWIGQATQFTSGQGYTRYTLPATAGLQVSRTDVVPDGPRGVLYRLTITNPGAARTTRLTVDAHSELMGQFPWGFTGLTPNASDNLPDHGRFTSRGLEFTDDGALPGAPVHHYAAAVGATTGGGRLQPVAAAVGRGFWGPQPGHRCTGTEPGAPTEPKPSQCDDGPFGNGVGGRLTYSLRLARGATTTVWLGVAGSDHGISDARNQLSATLHDPAGALARKVSARQQLADRTRLDLPGDRLAQAAVDWGKQNMADLTQTATDLQVRWTNQGRQFPPPLGTVPKVSWIGAGYPDYPWIFGTDAEYTAFAALSVGQFEAIEDHLRALKTVSDLLNHRSGVVAHEVVSDGSVYFGHDSRQTNSDGTTSYDFNTDETVKFPSTVALVWRWTGDDAFRDQMYDFTVRNLKYVVNRLDADHDGWPEGTGNVERTGMGPEKLDNAVYLIRGLYDLADMARSKGDTATATWATRHADDLHARFDRTWWDAAAGQYADSLDVHNQQVFQKHWIGQTPMEAQLALASDTSTALAPYRHGVTALAGRENACYSGTPPDNPGLFHTACGGGPDGAGEEVIYGLTTSIQSVGEGNYGRLGPGQQQRYLHALAQTMFAEPATGGTPDEQPGAMPEVFPSPAQGPNIDRCWTCRSMVMQAWGNYGTAWPVVHQWLGVSPDLGRHVLDVVPQVPAGQTLVRGSDIRLGGGSADVSARHDGTRYTTWVSLAPGTGVRQLVIGHTLPRGARPTSVRLDGHVVDGWHVVQTDRGAEVTVATTAGTHTLVVTT